MPTPNIQNDEPKDFEIYLVPNSIEIEDYINKNDEALVSSIILIDPLECLKTKKIEEIDLSDFRCVGQYVVKAKSKFLEILSHISRTQKIFFCVAVCLLILSFSLPVEIYDKLVNLF